MVSEGICKTLTGKLCELISTLLNNSNCSKYVTLDDSRLKKAFWNVLGFKLF